MPSSMKPVPAASPALTARPWQLAHPLWQCGFRPFFVATVLFCVGLLGLWLLFLAAGWPLPGVPGGAVVWHVHELLMGATLAAVAGFALTAVPEFTDTPSFEARHVRWLLGLWLLGRLSFWLSGWWPQGLLALSGVFHVGFMGMLTVMVAPRLWRDPGHRQQGFWWAFVALIVTVAGFYVDAVQGEFPMPWLHATLGVLMALIVVAMSRISMAIVNSSIDDDFERRHPVAVHAREQASHGTTENGMPAAGPADRAPVAPTALPVEEDEPTAYLARPPRRHLAVICIMLFTAMQWFDPANRVIEVGSITYSDRLKRTRMATEAQLLLAQYVFETLKYRRYEWKCDSLNQPSRNAALRLGFTYEGMFRQAIVYKGRNRDTCWYSMLDSEWPRVKRRLEKWLSDDNFDAEGRQRVALGDIEG